MHIIWKVLAIHSQILVESFGIGCLDFLIFIMTTFCVARLDNLVSGLHWIKGNIFITIALSQHALLTIHNFLHTSSTSMTDSVSSMLLILVKL